MYRGELANRIKYIFVYGNAFDSAVSAFGQGELRGSAWLDEHIFHLCGVGSPDEVLKADVLNYEAQLKAWQNSPAFIVHYSEIWELKDELAKYLGFPFVLPTQKARSSNIPHSSLQVNRILFNRLKNYEERFASRGIFPFLRTVLSINLIFLKVFRIALVFSLLCILPMILFVQSVCIAIELKLMALCC